MAMLQLKSLFVLCLGLAQVNGHFLLNYPSTVGFDDDIEGTAPCGGFSAPFSNATDFHVDGDAIALTSTHPSAVWIFRGTLDTTASSNWTEISQPIAQDALGNFCEPGITVPSSWAGHSGVLQITQDATDGSLYQCALVNFVSGAATTLPSSCKNATGLTAGYTTLSASSSTVSAASKTSMATSLASTSSASGLATSVTPTSSASTSTATAASDAPSILYAPGSWLWASVSLIGPIVGFTVMMGL